MKRMLTFLLGITCLIPGIGQLAQHERCYNLAMPFWITASGPHCEMPHQVINFPGVHIYRFRPSSSILIHADRAYNLHTPDYDATVCCKYFGCFFIPGLWIRC